LFQNISNMVVKYCRYVWRNISELYWNIRTFGKSSETLRTFFWNISECSGTCWFVWEHEKFPI